jgi:hypothetical protein
MIGRGLDSNNDLIVENGQFKLVEDGAEVVQHVRTRLLFYKEEWFLNLQAGVPYFQEIFIKPASLANTESIIKSKILNTRHIESLTEFEMQYDNLSRKISISFSAITSFGTIDNEKVTINV